MPPLKIIAMIATFNRIELLLNRSLKSVALQSKLPDAIVIVNDGIAFNQEEMSSIVGRFDKIPVYFLTNALAKGAAGSWNTGLIFIDEKLGDCYVAILDDDDHWDSTHLQICFEKAVKNNADAVVSGLRFWMDGKLVDRPIITDLDKNEFLVGNPGWQGSNTFVRISRLMEIGGFFNGMLSLNDRYLAIQLLSLPDLKIAFTNVWTSNWVCHSDTESLSSVGSFNKLSGMKLFWSLFNQNMDDQQKEEFLLRGERLFKVSRNSVLGTDLSMSNAK